VLESPNAVAGSRRGVDSAAAGPVRLLVADDYVDLNDALSAHLRTAGWPELYQAFDGLTALQFAQNYRPALILLDLELPLLDGQLVLRALRRDPATASIKIIVLTGYPELLTEADRQRAFAVVRKPFDLRELTALVRRALARPSQ
jgi:CheY-like chemotaxis protein